MSLSLGWIVLAFYLTGTAVMQRAQRLARGRSRTTRLMFVVGLYLAGVVCSALWVATGADSVAVWVRVVVLAILVLATATLVWAMSVLVGSLRETADPSNGTAP